MRVLITAGPTREAIDPVRYISNRSSGQMGAALAGAALKAGHEVSLILGPIVAAMPNGARRTDVETAKQMLDAVLSQFPSHDCLIMAAAVSDYRPKQAGAGKIARGGGSLLLELEPTEDIVAAASAIKRPDQRTIGFSLESRGNVDRAMQKLQRKKLDLIVYNPIETMDSATIESTLLYPDGRTENLPCRSKCDFADILIQRAATLFAI